MGKEFTAAVLFPLFYVLANNGKYSAYLLLDYVRTPPLSGKVMVAPLKLPLPRPRIPVVFS